jgi:hypothetical protein
VTSIPTGAVAVGEEASVADEQGGVYWYCIELKASQRPKLFPEVPVLFKSFAQTATKYVPAVAPLTFHCQVALVE